MSCADQGGSLLLDEIEVARLLMLYRIVQNPHVGHIDILRWQSQSKTPMNIAEEGSMSGGFEMITLVFREMSREGRNYLGMEGGHSSSVTTRSKNVRWTLPNGFCILFSWWLSSTVFRKVRFA